uniref:ATP-binding protein n=1 Tax=Prevotella sp. TaxID=59823 RepID=UPI004029F33F
MTHQTNLFNTDPQVAGFKLDYMEVWNWGTFNDKVYRMNPHGNNSLLTGANASGKSTLIDALLALLVPLQNKRFYNQSSGAEKKGNRTDITYFFGNYGQQQEGESGASSLKLRDKSARSVLLATFNNSDGRVVTLFQIRYYSGEELRTVYGMAHKHLTISQNFATFDSNGVWRKRMEKELNTGSSKRIVEFFNGPKAYEEKMLLVFGMRSDKALTLFNQIVGVKVLNNLDSFIRDNMLEERDAEEKYKELRENFQNLMDAKTSIEKTKEQIRQLEPIDRLAEDVLLIEKSIKELQSEKDIISYWFAVRTVKLCQEHLERRKSELRQLDDTIKANNAEKRRLDEAKSSLEVAINSDSVGQQIKDIEKEIINLTERFEERKKKEEKYNTLIHKLELPQSVDSSTFQSNKATAQKQKVALQELLDNELAERKRHLQNEKEDIEANIKSHVNTIKYLSEHNNNISGRVAEIRDEIIQHIGATADEIPFIGELIRLKDDEREWESAIERILHNFALRLIVPEKYYRKVNEYVNNHNLRGRIVYQRYNYDAALREFVNRHAQDNSLLNKIEFKPNAQYIDWIEDRLYSEFNYTCVDTLEDFNHINEKAVTKEGLIKAKGGKHEKDDRPEISRREHYVLGWDNHEKISVIKKEHENLRRQLTVKNNEIKELDHKKKETEERKETFSSLLDFEKFDDIDWQSYSIRINEKKEEKKQLESTNDRVKTLQEQLEKVKLRIKDIETQNQNISRKQGMLDKDKKDTEERCSKNSNALALMDSVDVDEFENNHSELLLVGLEDIEARHKSLQNDIDDKIRKKQAEKSKKEDEAKSKIIKFKNPTEEITTKFRDWRSDVNSLPDSVEFISEYQNLLKKLNEEALPSFEKRFNKYLHETVINNIYTFRQFFKDWESLINKTINQLNSYLRDINFNVYPETYIQLESSKKRNVNINEFVQMLEKAIPNMREINSTIDGQRLHFEQHVLPLMQRLQDEKWRKEVMDVRARFSYKAVEHYKADDLKRNTYESMGQLSGGEKAQLTYTILGSAIAYQFGLTKHGCDSSFRFIAIDEAFRAQDEDKARYLISLCKQLHLQLLVVTPSDNIHIVENDISYVHYVERKGNTSVLYNMPINQFKEERQKTLESK